MKTITVLVGMLLALGLSSPTFAHKDHKKPVAAAAAPAPASGEHAGMDHGATAPRAGDLPKIEIGEHDERRQRVQDKPFFVRLLDWLGRFHTAVVHLPIGLTLGALIAEVIGWRRTAAPWRAAARVMLGIAAVGAIVAAVLGWINAGFYMTDTDGVLTWHRWLGTALVILAAALAYAAWRSGRVPDRSRTGYWWLLGVTSLAVAVQGYLGGALVHGGLDHLAF